LAEFDMMHSNGISFAGDVLDLAMAQKLIIRSGAWFRYGDLHLGQGREKTRAYLLENPALLEELKGKLLASGVESLSAADGGGEAAAAAE
jgi:recombination protein RecA